MDSTANSSLRRSGQVKEPMTWMTGLSNCEWCNWGWSQKHVLRFGGSWGQCTTLLEQESYQVDVVGVVGRRLRENLHGFTKRPVVDIADLRLVFGFGFGFGFGCVYAH